MARDDEEMVDTDCEQPFCTTAVSLPNNNLMPSSCREFGKVAKNGAASGAHGNSRESSSFFFLRETGGL